MFITLLWGDPQEMTTRGRDKIYEPLLSWPTTTVAALHRCKGRPPRVL